MKNQKNVDLMSKCPKLEHVAKAVGRKLGVELDIKTMDAKQFTVLLDANFSEVVNSEGQVLDIEQLFIDYQERDLAGLTEDPDRPTIQANSNSRSKAIRGSMSKLYVDERDQLDSMGWKARVPTKRCDLDNLDDFGFKSITHQMRAIAKVKLGKFDDRLEQAECKGQTEGTSDVGGFFLAPRFLEEVLMSVEEMASYLAMRRQFVMGEKSMIIPRLADEDRSSDQVAGLEMLRVAEGGAFSEAEIEIGQTRLSLSKAGRIIRVTNELMDDSAIGVDQVLNNVIGKSVALMQGRDFFSGNGAGEPIGFLNGKDLHVTDKVSGQGAVTIIYENVVAMTPRIDAGGGSTTVWLAHPSTFEQLAFMAVVVGTGGHAIWMTESMHQSPRTLMGFPIHFTEHALTLGNKGDINLVNMAAYFYAMSEQGLVIEASPHANWTTDELSFRTKLRDSGLPWRPSTKKDRQGYVTSNFVTLESRE